MSNYSKSTNFATKDNLTPGDPLKIVRGTEIDTEFNNIATAIATKTDNASAAITGGAINDTTIGATTASTGAFTTLAASGNVTLSGGTANGVAYLNGSKVVTSGSALTFNGTSFGVPNIDLNNGGVQYFYSTGFGSYFALTNNANALTFGYNGSEQMRLTSTGLGIGTSSIPTVGSTTVLAVGNANGGTHAIVQSGSIVYRTSASTSSVDFYTGNAVPLIFYTSGSERARIDSGGNLGVGTTSPAARLDVSGGSIRVNEDGVGTKILTIRSDWAGVGPAINVTTNDPLIFLTNNTERARIDSSGNLLVGKTAASASSGVGVQLEPSGGVVSVRSGSTNSDLTWYTYSTGAGAVRFYVGMGGTVYATSTTITAISDQRLKENIRDLDDGLDVVMALKPRKFDWKEGKGQDIKNARGFIAQEFEQVLPDMIEEWRDHAPEGEEPYKAINANLIPTLVKAIQEQQAIINQLKARLDAANL